MLLDEEIKCPICGQINGLSLSITAEAAKITIPIIDGKPTPSYELLEEISFNGDEALARYSSADGKTRIILFNKEISDRSIYCSYCNKNKLSVKE